LSKDQPRLPGRGSSLGGFGLAGIGLGVLAAETLNPARGIDQLLLTGEEGVTGGANFHVDIALVCGTRFKGGTARALHPDLFITWMYSLFWHLKKPFLQACNPRPEPSF
jgi:hypothetical protein